MNILGFVKSAFDVVTAFFGHAKARSDLKNAEDVKARRKAQDEIDATNATEKAIKEKDTKKIMEDMAE